MLNQLCDVKRYLSDPEKEVVWDDVASLQCCKEDGDCCPICLMEYSVPRATKCGHIFCLGCILYYFRQQNSEYTKCPMCSEIIGASSLRPVTFFSKRNRVKEGAKTTMELVVRHSTCVNAFSVLNPRLQHYLSVNIPSADAPIEDISFCHYLVSSPSYELNCAKDELKQLQKAESDMDCAGEVLMKGVVEMVRRQLNEFIAKRTNENENENENGNENGKKEIEVDRTSERNGADLLYYYTIPSNLSYHLLPLCFRCLCSFFGGYNDLPPLITASVNQIDDVEFVVDGRKDIVLNHMPAFSIVHWVELNVLSVIPGRIDASLFDKLKKREHARKKAKQQMKREDQRIRVHFFCISFICSIELRKMKRPILSNALNSLMKIQKRCPTLWTVTVFRFFL